MAPRPRNRPPPSASPAPTATLATNPSTIVIGGIGTLDVVYAECATVTLDGAAVAATGASPLIPVRLRRTHSLLPVHHSPPRHSDFNGAGGNRIAANVGESHHLRNAGKSQLRPLLWISKLVPCRPGSTRRRRRLSCRLQIRCEVGFTVFDSGRDLARDRSRASLSLSHEEWLH